MAFKLCFAWPVLAFMLFSCKQGQQKQSYPAGQNPHFTAEQNNTIAAQKFNNDAGDMVSGAGSDNPANIDRALRLLDSAIQRKPDYAFAYQNKEVLYWRKRDLNALLAQSEAFMSRFSPTAERLFFHAVIYDLRGEPAKAKPFYEKAMTGWNRMLAVLDQQPPDIVTLMHTAQYCAFAGDKARSNAFLKRLHEFPGADTSIKNYRLKSQEEWMNLLFISRDGGSYEKDYEQEQAARKK